MKAINISTNKIVHFVSNSAKWMRLPFEWRLANYYYYYYLSIVSERSVRRFAHQVHLAGGLLAVPIATIQYDGDTSRTIYLRLNWTQNSRVHKERFRSIDFLCGAVVVQQPVALMTQIGHIRATESVSSALSHRFYYMVDCRCVHKPERCVIAFRLPKIYL